MRRSFLGTVALRAEIQQVVWTAPRSESTINCKFWQSWSNPRLPTITKVSILDKVFGEIVWQLSFSSKFCTQLCASKIVAENKGIAELVHSLTEKLSNCIYASNSRNFGAHARYDLTISNIFTFQINI